MNVSVLIPTRDRAPTLERTLGELARQRLDGLAVEVIVVDNGSQDGTSELVRSLAGGFPTLLRLVLEPKPGASAARNAGAAAAHGELLLLLGDDTRPAEPGFLAGHAALHRQRSEATYAVLGHIAWAPELDVTPLMRWLDRGAQFDYGSIRPGPVGPGYFYTSNLSLKRELFELAGGFDERIPVLFEDLELAARLFDAGLELEYRPELLVYHDHPRTLPSWHARQLTAGRSARIANTASGDRGPLLPRPAGLHWRAVQMVGESLAAVPTEWTRLPGPLRALVYWTIHHGAYARGYRGDGGAGGKARATPAAPAMPEGRPSPARRLRRRVSRSTLDQLLRYEPVLRLVREVEGREIVEVGSGSSGIGRWLGPEWSVTAVDTSFDDYGTAAGPRLARTTAVVGDVRELPFADGAYDVAVALDVLEHLAADDRARALSELARVARRRVVVGCPAGSAARAADRRLADAYRNRGEPTPPWLQEHLDHGFPEPAELAAGLAAGGRVRLVGNENARSHERVMRLQATEPGRVATLLLKSLLEPWAGRHGVAGRVVGQALGVLRGRDRPPTYRTIAVLDKDSDAV